MNSPTAPTPTRRAVAAGLVVLALALAVGASPAQAAGRSTGRAGARANVPPTPRLVVTLRQDINASSHLTAAARMAVVEDVAWLQGRLDVILPRIHWTKPLLSIDGVYGQSTADATKFFKTWGNQAHAALHLRPLFPKIDDTVGATTEAIIALIGGYFQVHPNGAATSPQSDDQTTAMILLNRDRARLGIPVLIADPQMMSLAQGWSAHLQSTQTFVLQDFDQLASQITACAGSPAASSVGQDIAIDSSLPNAEAGLVTFVNPDDHTINIQNRSFVRAGVGVVATPRGIYLTIDFAECTG